eukprot:CAMPEP_0170481090 /NCGR_PEP_ID=MMETSP0208-20121228/1670_1 /TAXON_ID=197538 /ORGANISM="Strombidium inclinatum, Strain S3" /LENGTH=89 /DNA_ID=CAMNT_0010753735 /DNA_START=45 /DNA_END=314 /DNA_ORIENTATION=+
MNSNPNLTFTPHVSSGGAMQIGGSVGTGNVGQSGNSSATGAGVSLDLNLNMGGGSNPASSMGTVAGMNMGAATGKAEQTVAAKLLVLLI